jgi:hypothetical protein
MPAADGGEWLTAAAQQLSRASGDAPAGLMDRMNDAKLFPRNDNDA